MWKYTVVLYTADYWCSLGGYDTGYWMLDAGMLLGCYYFIVSYRREEEWKFNILIRSSCCRRSLI